MQDMLCLWRKVLGIWDIELQYATPNRTLYHQQDQRLLVGYKCNTTCSEIFHQESYQDIFQSEYNLLVIIQDSNYLCNRGIRIK